MKTCSQCRKSQELSEFYKKLDAKDGHYPYCKKCKIVKNSENYLKNKEHCNKKSAEYYKNNTEHLREKQREWASENREYLNFKSRERDRGPLEKVKKRARRKLRYGVVSGSIIQRNSCEICHNGPTVAHHEDYSKPLEVIWMCNKCHLSLHRQYKRDNILIPI